jgi:transposase
MPRVEIFHERARRRWSEADKRRLVAETFAPGETVHGVARRRGVSTSQLFTWRKRFRAEVGFPAPAPAVPGFAAVAIAPPLVPAAAGEAAEAPPGLIEIELAGGGRVRIAGAPDPAVVTAALRALVGR